MAELTAVRLDRKLTQPGQAATTATKAHARAYPIAGLAKIEPLRLARSSQNFVKCGLRAKAHHRHRRPGWPGWARNAVIPTWHFSASAAASTFSH